MIAYLSCVLVSIIYAFLAVETTTPCSCGHSTEQWNAARVGTSYLRYTKVGHPAAGCRHFPFCASFTMARTSRGERLRTDLQAAAQLRQRAQSYFLTWHDEGDSLLPCRGMLIQTSGHTG